MSEKMISGAVDKIFPRLETPLKKSYRIGEKVIVANDRGIEEADAENYFIRDGIVLVPRDAVVPAATVI